MKTYSTLLLLCFSLLFSAQALSQNNRITKLELKAKEIFIVGPTNMLLVDTLIMHDKSTIKFSPATQSILQANVAYIGNKCTLSSRGMNGEDANKESAGSPGQDGGDLVLIMHLNEVGSLTIDTRGGKGGNGKNGSNGAKGEPERTEQRAVKGPDGKYTIETVFIPPKLGTDGSNATTGFAGGYGGNIQLIYSTNGFVPIFNNSKGKNRIMIENSAGNPGKNGRPGRGGLGSMDGRLIEVATYKTFDGELRIEKVESVTL